MRTIKTYQVVSVAIATTLLLFGCRDLRTIHKDFQAKEISFDLPPIPVSGDFNFTQRSPLSLKSQIEAINIPLLTLKGLSAKEVVIELKDTLQGKPVTFDVLDNIYLYISTDSLGEELVAVKDPVPQTNSTLLTLDTDPNLNLLPYALSNEVIYRVKGKSNKATEKAVKMSIRIKWRVTVQVL